MDNDDESLDENPSSPQVENPMAYLGLRRRNAGETDSDVTPVKKDPGIALNRRGIPARKRKKNSLIYGADDLVSIPVKSPKKRGPKTETRRKMDSPSKISFDQHSNSSASPPSSLPSTPSKSKRARIDKSPLKKVASTKKEDKRQKIKIRDKNKKARQKFPLKEAKTKGHKFSEDEEDDYEHYDDNEDEDEEDKEDFDLDFKAEVDDEDYHAKEPMTSSKSPASRISRIPSSAKKKKTGVTPVSSVADKKRASAKKGLPAIVAAISGSADGSESELTSPEKKNAASLGVALRNLLKLPKAHKWVCFEFFYSNLDKVLFEGENDFMVCLRESFPLLQTRRLTRCEWSKIRRMMGKPRRCSAAFFAEERAELSRKRQKIRMLQQRKQGDVTNFKDLPDNIPLQLTIGARVTARLRKPQDGLFMGTVDAYDTSNNTYRIRFDRGGLATYSIPDEEVLSTDDPEMMPLSSFTAKARPRPQPQSVTPFLSPMKFGSTYSPQLANDPLLSGSTPRGKIMRLDGQVGGYPIKFLEQIVRLSKSLKQKRECVNSLRDLNSEGERKKSFGEIITEDFQRRYASNVIELANINRDLNEHLRNIQEFTQQFAPEAGPTISLPNIIREGCQEDAYDMVNKNNNLDEKEYVESPKILALISSFTALMLQVKQLAEGERNAIELQALQDAMSEVKQSLTGENLGKFENCVEVHMQHIMSGLSRLGNLHAFMMSMQPQKQQQQQPHHHQEQVTVKSDPG